VVPRPRTATLAAITLLAALVGFAQESGAQQAARASELVKRLRTGRGSVAEREKILDELWELGAAAEAPLAASWASLPTREGAAALEMLSELGSKRALQALLEAARSPKVAHQRAAAQFLAGFGTTHSSVVAKVQLSLMSHSDTETVRASLGCLRTLAPASAWPPVLRLLRLELHKDTPRQEHVELCVTALAGILAANPDPERVAQVFRLCDETREPSAVPLGVLAESEAPVVAPFMRRLLEHAYELGESEPERAAHLVDSVFDEGGPADALRPFSPETRAKAVEALGRCADRAARPLMLRALADRTPAVRRVALRYLRFVVPSNVSGEVIQRVANLLVDSEPALRREAHVWLRRATGARLPMSYTKWIRYSRGVLEDESRTGEEE
jgi:HEAT repeat protein